jgi:hypothetical protein
MCFVFNTDSAAVCTHECGVCGEGKQRQWQRRRMRRRVAAVKGQLYSRAQPTSPPDFRNSSSMSLMCCFNCATSCFLAAI